jgi:23S rRNA (uracil1939-C5)-methyltransferase
VGRLEGLAIFVTGAAPGELVRAKVRKTHRRHAEADVIAVEKPSADRVEPRCLHFTQGCGGCSWQHVAYSAQLEAKAAAVRDSLERLGGFRDLPMRPILPAPEPFGYRNKMEFAFHPDGILGLHPRGAWYDILRLDECHLQSSLALDIVKAAQAFVESHKLSCYHPRSRQGFLRELCVRQSRGTGEILLGIATSPGAFPEGEAMAAHLARVSPTSSASFAASAIPRTKPLRPPPRKPSSAAITSPR